MCHMHEKDRQLTEVGKNHTLVGCPGRDQATVDQHDLPPRHSREVARLKLAGIGTIVAMDD
jgi:hypothetical protein